jgi:DNA-binding transcriptional regulator YdaS (Cro superfamily)
LTCLQALRVEVAPEVARAMLSDVSGSCTAATLRQLVLTPPEVRNSKGLREEAQDGT